MAPRRKFYLIVAVFLTQVFFIAYWVPRSHSFVKYYASSGWYDFGGVFRSEGKIFCMVLTQPKNLEGRAKAVYETWAHKCDYHRFVSVIPDLYANRTRRVAADSTARELLLLNYTVLQPEGLDSDTYRNLTKKVLYSIRQIAKIYEGKFDWFLKVDDDTFVFVDNLREFVKTKSATGPHTYGYNFKVIVDKGYHSGGGGYLLTKEAFARIARATRENFKFCADSGVEDVDIGRCLRRLNVTPDRSEDDCGHERFHPLSMKSHVYGNFPGWLKGYAENPPKNGEDCCSNQVISFHYVSVPEMYQMAEYLRGNQTKLRFRHMMQKLVPTTTTTTTTTTKTKPTSTSTKRISTNSSTTTTTTKTTTTTTTTPAKAPTGAPPANKTA